MTFSEKIKSLRYLILFLLVISFVILFANLYGKDAATLTSDWLNVLVSSSTLVLAFVIAIKTGKSGNHGKAWVLFVICIALWFIGERIWMINELVLKEKPWPSSADYFWLAGYLFFFAFSFYYLKSFKKSISKRMVVFASLVPLTVLGVTLSITATDDSNLSTYEKILDDLYPILDALSLVPIILGLTAFFKGGVVFSWALLFFGMLSFVVSDLGYLYLSSGTSDLYYTGHPVDIPYLYAYVLFSFGIFYHLKIFSASNKKKPYHDQKNLR